MNVINHTLDDCCQLNNFLLNLINQSDFKPEVIVGITRGGLFPAVTLSNYLELPMYTMDIRLHDPNDVYYESNCCLAELASGYECERKNILIVEDFVNTGATLNWIMEDWESANSLADWNEIWHQTTRFASLVHNVNADCTVDFCAYEIEKDENDEPKIVFPWRSNPV